MRQRGARLTASPTRHARTMRSLPTGPVEDSSSALFPVGRRGPYPGRTTPVGGLRMAQVYSHAPVLVDEVARLLSTVPPGVVIDGTLGAGGHAAAILDRRDDVVVLGLDRDPEAIAAGSEALERYGRRAIARQARFSTMASALQEAKDAGLTGPRTPSSASSLDLGVSSHQLDTSARGFSYRNEGPLDMRMGPDDGPTAAEFLRDVDEDDAHRDPRRERRASLRPWDRASRSSRARRRAPRSWRRRSSGRSPRQPGGTATWRRRTFQALRIAVNEELDELAGALAASQSLLVASGRLVVISYHSGEDALVKSTLRDAATGGCICPPLLPCVCGAVPTMRLVTRGAHKAGAEEIERNPRARSARLRAAERLDEAAS